MKYTDVHGNVSVHLVKHPDIVYIFFADAISIDKHNQSQQFNLALEKIWLTQDPYFSPPDTREDAKVAVKKFAGRCCVINLYLTLLHLFQLHRTPVCSQKSVWGLAQTHKKFQI